jgi:phage-related protein
MRHDTYFPRFLDRHALTAYQLAGFLLRRLQRGELLPMPQSRPMPSIGARCHELRINDGGTHWRLVYPIDTDAIAILEVFAKKDRSYTESRDRHVP